MDRPTSRPRPTAGRRPAFTLVELMVVIGIIGIIFALLLSTLVRVRDQARRVTCMANLRSLGQAFIEFSTANHGNMPGGCYDTANPDPLRRDWAVGGSPGYLNAPQKGTIFPYVSKNYETYRCPTLDVVQPGSGVGSNGRFDYTIALVFTGAYRPNIPAECTFTYPDGTKVFLPTPVLVEEDPAKHMNHLSMEASWGSVDEFSKTHRGGGQFAAVDGSVHMFRAPAGTNTYNWTVKTRKGAWANLGKDVSWGWWNSQ